MGFGVPGCFEPGVWRGGAPVAGGCRCAAEGDAGTGVGRGGMPFMDDFSGVKGECATGVIGLRGVETPPETVADAASEECF